MKTKEELLKIYSSEQLLSLEDLPCEIWKPHPLYTKNMLSNLGRVKSENREVKHNYGGTAIKKAKILKQNISNGYLVCGITINGKTFSKRVHRLVAETFLESDTSRLFVNHINGIKTDNRLDNLEWVTAQENTKHAWRLGLMKPTIDKIAHDKFKIISNYLNYDIEVSTPMGIGKVYMCDTCLKIAYKSGKKENLVKSIRSWGSEFKIILRTMDYLTKEIEHKGEKFIPIEKLLDIESGTNWSASDYLLCQNGLNEYWVRLKDKEKSFVFGFNVEKQYFYMHNQFGNNKSVFHQLELFNKLFEWHFNVFGLSDSEYIKKETSNQ